MKFFVQAYVWAIVFIGSAPGDAISALEPGDIDAEVRERLNSWIMPFSSLCFC